MSIIFEKDEYVIYEARRHWFVFATEVFVAFIIFLVPLVVHWLAVKTDIIFFTADGHLASAILFFYTIWILGIWMSVMLFWTDYYLDVLIVTNKRVIDVEQKGLFSREISYFSLEKIQDIKSEVTGIIATFLKFGDLHIQTAGQQREFVLRYVKEPDQARENIDKALRNLREI